MPNSNTILSPAKLNLTLDVFTKQNPNAPFHEIKTILHQISLFDEITLTPSDIFKLEGSFSCNAKDNLITQAWHFVQKFYSKKLPPVHVHVRKNIPEGSGLGGGSSNFASFLILYYEMFGLGNIPEALKAQSSEFGKDIPFFLEQKKCSIATNYGEVLQELSLNLSKKRLYLYLPKFSHPSKESYQKLKQFDTNYTETFLQNPQLENCGNTFDQFLESEKYQEILKALPMEKFHLTGSGSTFFSLEKYDVPQCQCLEIELL